MPILDANNHPLPDVNPSLKEARDNEEEEEWQEIPEEEQEENADKKKDEETPSAATPSPPPQEQEASTIHQASPPTSSSPPPSSPFKQNLINFLKFKNSTQLMFGSFLLLLLMKRYYKIFTAVLVIISINEIQKRKENIVNTLMKNNNFEVKNFITPEQQKAIQDRIKKWKRDLNYWTRYIFCRDDFFLLLQLEQNSGRQEEIFFDNDAEDFGITNGFERDLNGRMRREAKRKRVQKVVFTILGLIGFSLTVTTIDYSLMKIYSSDEMNEKPSHRLWRGVSDSIQQTPKLFSDFFQGQWKGGDVENKVDDHHHRLQEELVSKIEQLTQKVETLMADKEKFEERLLLKQKQQDEINEQKNSEKKGESIEEMSSPEQLVSSFLPESELRRAKAFEKMYERQKKRREDDVKNNKVDDEKKKKKKEQEKNNNNKNKKNEKKTSHTKMKNKKETDFKKNVKHLTNKFLLDPIRQLSSKIEKIAESLQKEYFLDENNE